MFPSLPQSSPPGAPGLGNAKGSKLKEVNLTPGKLKFEDAVCLQGEFSINKHVLFVIAAAPIFCGFCNLRLSPFAW